MNSSSILGIRGLHREEHPLPFAPDGEPREVRSSSRLIMLVNPHGDRDLRVSITSPIPRWPTRCVKGSDAGRSRGGGLYGIDALPVMTTVDNVNAFQRCFLQHPTDRVGPGAEAGSTQLGPGRLHVRGDR